MFGSIFRINQIGIPITSKEGVHLYLQVSALYDISKPYECKLTDLLMHN